MIDHCQKVRDKFRQQIRSKHLAEVRSKIRTKMLAEEHGEELFIQMHKKIMSSVNDEIDMEIVAELGNLLDNYPHSQNTYILIGNYTIFHPSAQVYFLPKVVILWDKIRDEKIYTWCLTVLSNQQKVQPDVLADIDTTLSLLINNRKNNSNLLECLRLLNILMYYQKIEQRQKYFPVFSVRQFFKIVSEIDFQETSQDIKHNIIQIMYNIGLNHFDQQKQIARHLPQIAKVIHHGIAFFPTFRPEFIYFVKKIILDYFDSFEYYLFETKVGQLLIEQIQYIFQQTFHDRSQILTILFILFQSSKYQNIIKMLNISIHISLSKVFDHPDVEQIRQTFQIYLYIFEHIRDKGDDNLLDKVLDSLEEHQFKEKLTKLLQQRMDSKVEQLATELLDEYFSYEIE